MRFTWKLTKFITAMLILILLQVAQNSSAQLPGFVLNGENWTYSVAGEKTISGILLKPAGNGPFPAVVISHGLNGTATGFSKTKAQEMVSWGMVCIGPRYTHGTGDPDYSDGSSWGAQPENMRRAAACLDILQSLSYVDGSRICAYGNSAGGFVTVQLAADEPVRLRTAAITASGIQESGEGIAPNPDEADLVVAPFLMLHGGNDTTVIPGSSLLLKQVLDGNGIINRRVVYAGVGHNLHQDRATEVYAEMESWFDQYNTPPSPPSVDFHDDFEDGNATGWTTAGGTWSVVTSGTKVYKQTDGNATAASYAGDAAWDNYYAEVKVKPVTFNTGATVELSARYTDSNNKYVFNYNKDQGKLKIMKKVGGIQSLLIDKTYTINAGTTYTFKAELDGATLRFFVNGVQELATSDYSLTAGKIALATYKAVAEFDEVTVDEIGAAPVIQTYVSTASEDGYMVESTETSNVGGTCDAAATGSAGLRIGDTATDQQYKSIVSFDTSGIPDGATILSATLRIHRGTISGTNPFTTHGACYADIKGGAFSSNAALQNGDFEASANALAVATMSNAATNWTWSEGALNTTGLGFISKTGRTQFRVRFATDDNDDAGQDYIGFCPGDYTDASLRPQLVIAYQP